MVAWVRGVAGMSALINDYTVSHIFITLGLNFNQFVELAGFD
jgi:hypothetical protein